MVNINNKHPDLSRIVVVGSSCSGKTTLCLELAKILNLEHLELDNLYWLQDWKFRPAEEFRNLVKSALPADNWIADGNYSVVRDIIWSQATAVIWLNYSLATVLFRALRRAIRNGLSGCALCSGNKESLQRTFFSKNSIILWILSTFYRRRSEISALRASGKFSHLFYIELRNAHASRDFLKRLRAAQMSDKLND